MKKLIIILLGYLLLTSCKEKKTEFVESKVIKGFFVVKNLPKDDSLTKKIIKDFLLKNPKIPQDSSIHFYSDNSDTKYFLDHLPDPGGFSSRELEDIEEYNIAKIFFIRCKNDSTKLVGKLRFDNNYGNFYRPDTLIYKCN